MKLKNFKDRDQRIKNIWFNVDHADTSTLGDNLDAVVNHLVDSRLPRVEGKSGKIEEVPLLTVQFNRIGNIKSYCWTYRVEGMEKTESDSVRWKKSYGK